MQKNKSNKKANNKTFNSASKKDDQSRVPVKNIMKEIGQLKKQLVSIKSKKYLQLEHNNMRNSVKEEQAYKYNRQLYNKSEMQNKIANNKTLQQKTKQNIYQCRCASATKRQISKNHIQQPIEPLRAELFSITAPKSRQSKLKLQIQQNKLKSILEKLLIQSPSSRQSLKLLTSQLNFTMSFLNTIIKQLQTQLFQSKQKYCQMRTDLSELSQKIMKVGEKYSNQKNLTCGQMEQIAELKRQLSYYITLMKDNKDEAEKYSKQYQDLQAYTKQLQKSNQLLRKQLKLSQQKKQQYFQQLKIQNQQVQSFSKKFSLMQQDLHLSTLQSQKNKQKRRQIQKLHQKQLQQKRQITHKLSQKQSQLQCQQKIQKQLKQTIKSLQNVQNQYMTTLSQKKMQLQKLERENTIFSLAITQKQELIAQQEQQIKQIKVKLDSQIKANKKLCESLEYCQMQIDGLSEQIDQLRKANQRYKNQHFRAKLVRGQEEKEKEKGYSTNRGNQFDSNKNTFRKQQKGIDNLPNTQSKNRKKILGQIQELIEKHRKSSDSQSESQS